jgi:hypothetical protein
MKLVPTTEKVTIKWFVYSMGTKLSRTSSMRGSWDGYDASCSCGWESKTGAGVKSWVTELVETHKSLEHNYEWQSSVKLYAASILGEAK